MGKRWYYPLLVQYKSLLQFIEVAFIVFIVMGGYMLWE